jgi:hypothetical protein
MTNGATVVGDGGAAGPRDGQFDELIFEGHTEAEVLAAFQGNGRRWPAFVSCSVTRCSLSRPSVTSGRLLPCDNGLLTYRVSRLVAPTTGRTVTGARRKGKHMWVELSSKAGQPNHVLFHMGMTGSLVLRHKEVIVLHSFCM